LVLEFTPPQFGAEGVIVLEHWVLDSNLNTEMFFSYRFAAARYCYR